MMDNISGNINESSLECDDILFNVNYEIFDVILSSILALFGIVYTFFGKYTLTVCADLLFYIIQIKQKQFSLYDIFLNE